MSLTSSLYQSGGIADWWNHSGADFARPCAEIAQRSTAKPRPYAAGGRAHAAMVGSIVGRMLERSVEPAPAYAAIMGGGTSQQATLWPTHANLAAERREHAVSWRPTPDGWQELVPTAPDGAHAGLIAQAAAMENDPAATTVDRATAAAALCAVEHRYRNRTLGTIDDAAITDAVRTYSAMSSSRHAAETLCGGTLAGHAAPVFAPHWAEGDVLLRSPGGNVLVEIKTVGRATATNPALTGFWLAQALSYVACDVAEDLWKIRRVALWLPRQDQLVAWTVDVLLDQIGLSSRDMRRLASVCERTYAAEAAQAGWKLAN